MKISDTLEQFKRYMLLSKGLKPKSFKSVEGALKNLKTFAKSEEIKCLTSGIIREALQDGIVNKLWKPKTVHNQWQYLKSFFDFCLKNGFVEKNPLIEVEKPKLPKQLPRCLSKENALKILYHAAYVKWTYKLERSRNETIVNTLIFTGLRLQELLNLQTTDVNLSDETILVRQGKGGKDRIVPIHPHLMPKLRGYLHERQESLKPSQWFFTGIKSDKKLGQKDIRRILKVISQSSGVKVTAHMLRHTFGKLMVEADFNIYKLKEIMGHEQVTTTQRYVSVTSQSIKESFNKIQLL